MASPVQDSDPTFISSINIGVLLLLAAGLSILVYEVAGHWGGGQGGWVTAGMAVLGLALIGQSLLRG